MKCMQYCRYMMLAVVGVFAVVAVASAHSCPSVNAYLDSGKVGEQDGVSYWLGYGSHQGHPALMITQTHGSTTARDALRGATGQEMRCDHVEFGDGYVCVYRGPQLNDSLRCSDLTGNLGQGRANLAYAMVNTSR